VRGSQVLRPVNARPRRRPAECRARSRCCSKTSCARTCGRRAGGCAAWPASADSGCALSTRARLVRQGCSPRRLVVDKLSLTLTHSPVAPKRRDGERELVRPEAARRGEGTRSRRSGATGRGDSAAPASGSRPICTIHDQPTLDMSIRIDPVLVLERPKIGSRRCEAHPSRAGIASAIHDVCVLMVTRAVSCALLRMPRR
jgi:hypothetical protein